MSENKVWEGQGFVKEVPSGDSLILMGGAKRRQGPPPQVKLTLTRIAAPRLGRQKTENEDYAWHSREFLRELCIGKSVRFKVERKMDSGRSFGTVSFMDGSDLGEVIVAAGWAKVKEARGNSEDSGYTQLKALESSAKQEKKGLWKGPQEGVDTKCNVKASADFDTKKLFEQIEDTEVEAIIEYVRDGASFRVVLLPHMVSVVFNLAGVACPRIGRKPVEGEPVAGPEPYAMEAKHFAEVRLLNRKVPLHIKMLNKNGDTFLGSVVHPMGNISEEILKRGLGRTVDWSLRFAPDQVGYVRAEREAKQKKLRQWQNYQPPAQETEQFTGQVLEIVSGDTIVVLDEKRGTEERVSLSSVRTKRMGRRGQDPEPWAFEAKEHLRQLLVGKRCKVEIEYARTPQPRQPTNENGEPTGPVMPLTGNAAKPRRYGTVTTDDSRRKNAAVSLVKQGLGECVRHRQDDPRSRYYDLLLGAEVKAQRAKKGLHATKPAATHHFRDLTMTRGSSKRELPSLLRTRRHKAQIEYVFSGGRFKVFIPKMNCFLFFALSGMRCPSRARKPRDGKGATKPAEPLSGEAFTYSRHNLMQRDVVIEVEDMDKGGTALGAMFVTDPVSGDLINVGVYLLSKGLARIMSFSAERSPYKRQLEAAQAEAQLAKAGVWQFDQPEAEDTKEEGDSVQAPVAVKISEVVDGSTFYVHCDDDAATLAAVTEKMRAFALQVGTDPVPPTPPLPTGEDEEARAWSPRKGSLCAALFGAPAAWYRAEVQGFAGKGEARQANVLYIDYGNSELVDLNRLRPLDASYTEIDRLALRCVLSFLTVPSLEQDYGNEAAETFGGLVWDSPLTIQQTGLNKRQKTRSVLLYKDNGATCVNTSMVSSGFARVDQYARTPKSTKLQEVLVTLQEAGETAHTTHQGMFEYGDPAGDDEI